MLLFAEGGHHVPLIVEFINHYLGEPVHHFQMNYTKPVWDKFFSNFGTEAEAVFGPYTVENAIPWYTIMFVIACFLTIFVVGLLKGKLSEDDPKHGQLTLEAGYLAIKDMITSIIGEHGYRHLPVVATFGILILVSNLMGQFPMFMSPTASVNVTLLLRRDQRKRILRTHQALCRSAFAARDGADHHAADLRYRIDQ
jgi:F-type H+-transporting ATPase subunit a